ncbi:unnamed protein product [Ilex paraguariensis]|uniref:Uncharacterized protein n=1 Tax=Ilex paraguariensis TaxID=185542 RepID=A0ABC8TB37_9AQUA
MSKKPDHHAELAPPGSASQNHEWKLPPVQAQKTKGKENAHSLRRHYPVQVQRDFLSLTCLHLGLASDEADTDTPGAFLTSMNEQNNYEEQIVKVIFITEH